MKDLEKVLKELKERNINVLDLEIANEIKWQTDYNDRKFTDEEKQKLWNYVDRAYLKSEDLTVEQITRAAIKYIDKLDDMEIWDLIEEACWF